MARNRTRLAAVVIAAVSVLVVSACGHSSSAAGDNPGTGAGGDAASAADFPSQDFEYVVPYNPGGSTDPVGREFSRLLADELGTRATVTNRPGGDETIGVASVLEAAPDGYTLGLTSASGIIVQPLVNDQLSYKEPSDFTSVVKMVEAPNALLVKGDGPFRTLDDFVRAAKEKPGQIRVGTTGRLTNNTFALLALEKQAGIDLNIVPFSGGAGEAVRATLGGQVEAAIPTAAAQLGLVQAGELRALAHTGDAAYNAFLPGAVPFSDAGFDVPFSSDYLTVAPKGLPPAVRGELVEAALTVAKSDDWAKWCKDNGYLADPMAGPELDAWIQGAIEDSRAAIVLSEG
ncbi:Bug family tripartite tricarboxylate transporter substrate binding protein [Pseudonocardia alaniniphila]|uniref:Tripartite tricarboxylate transporter substrate binding protein n=1 Tax=Pseudonocardia alaniniphila TaxID=75291 RepID=A0ABS9TU79_9PSEU|nr:tripartite tricarboxylate transporter substrate binding protein [Pseudonocardia alaniniphila]MCH6172051.1 tripartite tricarboxylate transporter substrate binding protein [Pseudonocardia alaniniphila]